MSKDGVLLCPDMTSCAAYVPNSKPVSASVIEVNSVEDVDDEVVVRFLGVVVRWCLTLRVTSVDVLKLFSSGMVCERMTDSLAVAATGTSSGSTGFPGSPPNDGLVACAVHRARSAVPGTASPGISMCSGVVVV